MRLATIATPSGPHAAVYLDGHYVDLDEINARVASLEIYPPRPRPFPSPTTVRSLLEGGPEMLKTAESLARGSAAVRIPAAEVKLLPPIPDPPKIVCIGLNYRDHAAETGAPIPRDPVLFSKFTTALIGAGENIVLPPVSQKVDYEAELVLVIGRAGRFIPREQAGNYLAGYMVGHDVSARDWQIEKDGKQWLAGKTFDTFAPTGPWLVTADEVRDPHELGIRLRLNGQTMQDSNTRQLIFRAEDLIAYISQVVTLQPGDLIFTGTPPGVGMARKPPVWLKAGDVVEVEIDGLGVLRNPVVQG